MDKAEGIAQYQQIDYLTVVDRYKRFERRHESEWTRKNQLVDSRGSSYRGTVDSIKPIQFACARCGPSRQKAFVDKHVRREAVIYKTRGVRSAGPPPSGSPPLADPIDRAPTRSPRDRHQTSFGAFA
ncbi:hypothetical protein EVAR_102095_1 [Eumeta japonica]|uniref:Uncharacterized protein n=1 Tax=Eumeta variegata TaxID=151549 RepID=A0A4C1TZX2_EUMVA|nr:hypothetical protein EVAR_102095_1 [Eumeta japonica]